MDGKKKLTASMRRRVTVGVDGATLRQQARRSVTLPEKKIGTVLRLVIDGALAKFALDSHAVGNRKSSSEDFYRWVIWRSNQ